MPKRRTLTAKQKAFVKEYLANGQNAVRAWMVATGRPGNAPTNASYRRRGMMMLHTRGVQDKLGVVQVKEDQAIQEYAAIKLITKERILDELAKIAFTSATDAVSWDENGNKVFKPSADLPAGVQASIAEIQGSGKDLKIKHHDKKDALLQLGRHLGMFTEKTENVHKHQHVTFVIEKE